MEKMKRNITLKLSKAEMIMYPLLIPYAFLIAYLSYKRVPAFGCFDDCFNYVAAYFMLQGKTLYSQIFFNHQMLPAYISYVVQVILHPKTIPQLLLYHRALVFLFGAGMDVLLIMRFRLKIVGFIVFFEITKFIIFGNRFLAESFIVYPLVYLFGILWERIEGKVLRDYELVISAVAAWFVIFMREPYIPLAIVLYGIIFLLTKKRKTQIVSLGILGILSAVTIFTVPLSDYFFNVVTVTSKAVAGSEVKSTNLFGVGILRSFGYPLAILIEGKWTVFRQFLIGIDVIFLFLFVFFVFVKKKYKVGLLIIVSLGLANLRVVPPGQMYYEAFHMVQWYGLFLIAIFFMLDSVFRSKKIISYGCLMVLVASLFFVNTGNSVLFEKADRQKTFITNYGREIINGEIINRLANPSWTVFVDKSSDLVYWDSGLHSSFKYSVFTYLMPAFPIYEKAREEMLVKNPPDFLYGSCNVSNNYPPNVEKDYKRFIYNGIEKCLLIKKTDIPLISKKKWKSIEEFHYHL